jgi:hypothetical protein
MSTFNPDSIQTGDGNLAEPVHVGRPGQQVVFSSVDPANSYAAKYPTIESVPDDFNGTVDIVTPTYRATVKGNGTTKYTVGFGQILDKPSSVQFGIGSWSDGINTLSSNGERWALQKTALDVIDKTWIDTSYPLISPNNYYGATQTDRIKAAIAFIKIRGNGVLWLGADNTGLVDTSLWVVTEAVILPSNCYLFLDNAELRLANGVFDNVVRNEGIVVDPANPNSFPLRIDQNRNIRIYGVGAGAKITTPLVPKSAPHPINGGANVPWTGDKYGWRTIGVLMANVQNLEISGFTHTSKSGWGIVVEHGVDNFHIHDIISSSAVGTPNGDGIDVISGSSNGIVENITGTTTDDIVALGALKDFHNNTFPDGAYIWPMQVGGFNNPTLGNDINNVHVRNVSGTFGAGHAVIALPAGGGKIKNCSIQDVVDTGGVSTSAVVSIYTGGYGPISIDIADCENLVLSNIRSNFTTWSLIINTPAKNLTVNKIRGRAGVTDKTISYQAYYINGGLTESNIVVEYDPVPNLFDDVWWTPTAITLGALVTDPIGGTTARPLIAGTGSSLISFKAFSINQTRARSVYAKANGKNFLYLYNQGVNSHGAAWFNLTTGAVQQTTGTTGRTLTAFSEDVGGGWWKCTISQTTAYIVTNGNGIGVSDASGLTASTANATDGVIIWNHQHQPASYTQDLTK